jgi:hypothetical protein
MDAGAWQYITETSQITITGLIGAGFFWFGTFLMGQLQRENGVSNYVANLIVLAGILALFGGWFFFLSRPSPFSASIVLLIFLGGGWQTIAPDTKAWAKRVDRKKQTENSVHDARRTLAYAFPPEGGSSTMGVQDEQIYEAIEIIHDYHELHGSFPKLREEVLALGPSAYSFFEDFMHRRYPEAQP